MSSKRLGSRQQSRKVAFCGLMVALSVTLMLCGGLIPIATYCVPMGCGVLLLPILIEYGKQSAWSTYAAVSLLSILLGIDKEAAFFYMFLGYYPILKWSIDRIKRKLLRLLTKLLIFNGAVLLMYAVLGFVLNMDALDAEFSQMGMFLLVLFILMLNACLLLYDRLLFPLLYLYVHKLQPKLKFIHR